MATYYDAMRTERTCCEVTATGVTVIYPQFPNNLSLSGLTVAVALVLGAASLGGTVSAPAACAETGVSSGTAIAYVLPGSSAVGQLERLRAQAQQAYQATQFDQSLPIYQRISASGNATANDLYWLGESYFQIGQFASAAQAFEDSLKLDGSNDLLKVRVAESYFSSNQMLQARAACERGINTSSDQRVRQQLAILLKVCQKPLPEMQKGKFSSAQGHTER